MIYLFAFSAMLVFIALKAFQQLSVVHDQYWLITPISVAMGFCEVYIIASVSKSGFSPLLALVIGLGGAVGAMFSMYLHKKIRKD